MTHTETKFAYRHKPTGKWCHLEFNNTLDVNLHLVDDFVPESTAYKAINVIEEDFLRGFINSKRDLKHFPDFELVEIEVQYKIKNEHTSDSI